ncbi:MAG: hypothetical protein HUU37_02060 [Bdellovibrionales bacterium]|nr:hypothetical protein [Bdellovibrionales bacterium]
MRLLVFLLMSTAAFAADPAVKIQPYLGPGADKLSAEDYLRVYRNYIQQSALLGYPFDKLQAKPCDHALNAVFRQMGFYAYPVPRDARKIARGTFRSEGLDVEWYQLEGVALQVARKGEALDRLVLVNAATVQAGLRIRDLARKRLLRLQREKATFLERVEGVPVGYPHLHLTADSQGLFVKILKFNGKADGCAPVEFHDNSWNDGYALTAQGCGEVQGDVERVWLDQLSYQEFYERSRDRLRQQAEARALSRGAKPEEAKASAQAQFVGPAASAVSVVGVTMRNLAQCNQLAMVPPLKPSAGPAKSEAGQGAPAAGSAR